MAGLPVSADPSTTTRPGLRIALYSHDTVGLGHTRRSIAVATALIDAWPDADAMLVTGNPEATALTLPPRMDVVTLPTLAKDADGTYRSRTLTAPVDSVLQMRSAVIEAAVTSFAPDLLIVDKVPLGVSGELLPLLRRLRAEHSARIVLGLREILDDPVTAVAEWIRGGADTAIAEFYDQVWVYGDQRVYDPVVEYGLSTEVARRCVFTGYLAAGRFAAGGAPAEPPTVAEPYVLCAVGGGQDGGRLARTFAQTPLPSGHRGLVVCGPYMAPDLQAAVEADAAATPGMIVRDFVPDLDRLIAGAAAVVSMAGYNSVSEVLATDRPALLVPRTTPRKEQLIRALRLAELGAVEMLPPHRLTSRALAEWTASAVGSAVPASVRTGIELDGLGRLPGIADRLLGRPHPLTDRKKVDHRAA